ncbi:MAG: TonB family protein [Candidatus Accumulibacter sp.]|nr:TonB family protein [Accumulibacter sp.]
MLSLVLHGGLLCASAFRLSPAPRAPVLLTSLRLPPDPAKAPEPPQVAETLLKNTIDDDPPEEPAPGGPPKKRRERPVSALADERRMEAIRKQLSEYVFYPEQARRLGLEGTVTLFVEVSGDGRIEDVRVVASSGHPILDNAAIKGFYALGRLPGTSDHWDYTFTLE